MSFATFSLRPRIQNRKIKSCDRCSQSKQKCSRGYPCDRCHRLKRSCTYSVRDERRNAYETQNTISVTKDTVNQALARRLSDDAVLTEKINKRTGQTTCTESERPKEMGELQGARTCEAMECSSNYYFADNTAIPDDSSEETQIKESIKILIQMLKIQAEATDVKLENLAAKHEAQIKEIEESHNQQIALYKTHSCAAIEGLVNEVDRLQARVAQVERTAAMQRDSQILPSDRFACLDM